ncbi:MAG: hypothetical protein PF487_07530 [Bacteroidales bacterium]|jgi:hypothetical protein|nr:hypothetical protein [Bacteroidales bacterium]
MKILIQELMQEYSQVLDHLDKGNFDIMKLPEDMLLPYLNLKENGFNAVYDAITVKNNQGLDVIDSWKLTELNNDWIDFKKYVQSEVDEIVQTLHYEDMEVTDYEKKLLYQVKMGLITDEKFNQAIDRQRQAIIQSYEKGLVE